MDRLAAVSRSTPGSEAELFELVRTALAGDKGIVDSCSISGFARAGDIVRDCLILDLSAFNNIKEHVVLDLVAQAQCGISLARLNEMLLPHGQFFPVDFGDDITLGELIRLGDGGYLECGYGYLRSNILGIDFIDAGGNLIRAGGRVVKNVTGFDVSKLLIGYPLGLPLSAYLRLYALPQSSASRLVRGELSRLFDLSRSLLGSGLPLTALEIFEEEGEFRLFLQCSGPTLLVQDVIAAALVLVRSASLSATECGVPALLCNAATNRLEMAASSELASHILSGFNSSETKSQCELRYSPATQRLLFSLAKTATREELNQTFDRLKAYFEVVLAAAKVQSHPFSQFEPLALTLRFGGMPLSTHYFSEAGVKRALLFERVRQAIDPQSRFNPLCSFGGLS